MTETNPNPPELREKVARAICAVASRRGAGHPDEPADYGWEEWTEEAEVALSILDNETKATRSDGLPPYRTMDESGTPESAGTVGWNWISQLAQREREDDATLLVIDTTQGKVTRLYRGTKLLAAATTFRDDQNFTVLVRWTAPKATRSDEARLRVALAKCRDKFREYEGIHALKLRDYKGKEPLNYAAEMQYKIVRNREMAEMCDAALNPPGAE